jgi:hypothetical protein
MEMTTRSLAVGIFGLLFVAGGCATTSSEPLVAGGGPCDADAAQHLVGQTATQGLASTALRFTGALDFRWIPENSAVTMDYRPTRLNIEYDSDSIITAIRCG